MTQREDAPGVIDPACAYTVKELARRVGVTKDTVLSWKPFGLKIYGKAGGKVTIVKGADFIDWYTDTVTKPGPRRGVVAGRMSSTLTTEEAAAYLDVPVSTLEVWRSRGRPRGPVPVFVKLSARRVRYMKKDLDAFVAECRRFTTCQRAGE